MNPQYGSVLTSEEIYEELCTKIEKLEYMPGERLSENDLCKVYGVSRHVVRNALASLKQRHLVDVFPQRGTFVSLIDMEYIEDILYLRESVEQEALHRVMGMEDRTALLARLKQAVGAQRALVTGPSYQDEFYALDNIFHETMLAAVGKPNIMNLIAEPYIHIRRWRNFEIRGDSRMREIIEEHEDIVSAIEERDAARGHACLHRHLDTVSRYSKPLKEKEAQYFV